MPTQRRDYIAYLLRLWQVKDKGKTHWRASLENAHTGERVGFAGLDELFAFLQQQTGGELAADGRRLSIMNNESA